MIKKEEVKNIKIYFILTYILFWALLGLTGYLISLGIPIFFQNIMKNVCAWTPTFILLIMFRKLYPGIGLKEFLKLHFLKKINPGTFLVSFLLQAFILVLVVLAYFICNNKPLNTITFITPSNLIPRWISVWGVIAAILLITVNLLEVTGIISELIILKLPIVLNELVLAIWLLVKGFNPSAIK